MDTLLRLFFEVKEVRDYLGVLSPAPLSVML
jgi:hypothetical protein